MSHKTILPYVGGKQAVVKRLVRFFPRELSALGSPFIGGGSVEVHMAACGVRVHAADLCYELATFWQVLLDDSKALAERLKSKIPIQYPLDVYWDALLRRPDDVIEVAVLVYIVLSGKFSSIPTGGNKGSPQLICKLNRGADARFSAIRKFMSPGLSVEHLDCFKFLSKYPDLALYCDPPYANGSQDLYGFSEDLHSGFPHEDWRDALMAHKAHWVQSYGDCAYIRRLYAGCVIESDAWLYGSSNAGGNDIRSGRELVIRPPGSPPLSELMREAKAERDRAVEVLTKQRNVLERMLYW